MIEFDNIELRTPRRQIVIGLMASTGLLVLPFLGSSESSLHYYGKLLFLSIILLFVFFLLYLSMSATRLNASGLSVRRVGSHRFYSWDDVIAWGADYFPNGELTGIWVKIRDNDQKVFIEPISSDDEAKKVEMFLKHCCGASK